MAVTLELCHVFVFVADEGKAAAALSQVGLRESFRRTHPGQGTANLCACFENAYLELLWPSNRAELESPAVAPTRLAERAAWRDSGACPFGIALRTVPAEAPLPLPTWGYRQAFWPPDFALPVAEASRDPRQPFLFRSPGSARPEAWTDGRADVRQDGAEIAGLRLLFPVGTGPAAELRELAAAGVLELGEGPAYGLELLVTQPKGQVRRLLLPDLAWIAGSGARV